MSSNGLLKMSELAERSGVRLPEGPYETLAGFVQTNLGRVPEKGDEFEADGHRFTVVDMDGRRVSRVRIAALAPAREEDAVGEPAGSTER